MNVATEHRDPQRSASRAPEWVGEAGTRRDVAALSDRGVAVSALDVALRTADSLRKHADEFREFRRSYEDAKTILLRELPGHEQRVTALEKRETTRWRDGERDDEQSRGDARDGERLPSMRHEMPSSHEWDEMLVKAGTVLSQRVKDPRDRLDSNRARAIAEEVIKGAKVADDAQAFRGLKSRGQKIAWDIIKLLVATAVGALGAHYGLHGGG